MQHLPFHFLFSTSAGIDKLLPKGTNRVRRYPGSYTLFPMQGNYSA